VALFGEVLADRFPDRSVLGGAPFNVARHLRAFGLHPVLITRTGNDELREELLASMARFEMDTLGVQCDPAHPTGQVMVRMEQGGHRFEIPPDQAYDFIHAGVTRLVALSTQPELIYFGTLAQRHKISRQALNSLFRSVGAPRLLDVNLREPWYDAQTLKRSLLRADLVKINHEELASIARQLQLPGDACQFLVVYFYQVGAKQRAFQCLRVVPRLAQIDVQQARRADTPKQAVQGLPRNLVALRQGSEIDQLRLG